MTEKERALKKWARRVPASKIGFPEQGLEYKLKYVFWRLARPFHNPARDLLLRLGIIAHDGRQQYLLGHLASGISFEAVVNHLLAQGWGNHFIAWEDDGQIISLRKTAGFKRQYHLRIFADGEVRGHYEYTPEAHMIWHMKEVGMEERRDEFLTLLKDYITPARNKDSDFSWSFLNLSKHRSV